MSDTPSTTTETAEATEHKRAPVSGGAPPGSFFSKAAYYFNTLPVTRYLLVFVPITAGSLGMEPWKFYGVNVVAILVWAAAHILPGVLAVSALHQYAGLPHHEHVGKHLWVYAVVFCAIILSAAIWTIHRRHGRRGAAKAAK